jgi:hypothetical protein
VTSESGLPAQDRGLRAEQREAAPEEHDGRLAPFDQVAEQPAGEGRAPRPAQRVRAGEQPALAAFPHYLGSKNPFGDEKRRSG